MDTHLTHQHRILNNGSQHLVSLKLFYTDADLNNPVD